MNNSYRTAIQRKQLSGPAAFLFASGLLVGRLLDYGSGRGFDAKAIGATAYDPYFAPQPPEGVFDTILCTFVLNVIPGAKERTEVLEQLQKLLTDTGHAYISVRRDRPKLRGETSIGTWQGYVQLNLPSLRKTSSYEVYVLSRSDSVSA